MNSHYFRSAYMSLHRAQTASNMAGQLHREHAERRYSRRRWATGTVFVRSMPKVALRWRMY